jgi:hypothetical protein
MKRSDYRRLSCRASLRGCAAALAVFSLAGCNGGKPDVPFGTVHGRVTLDGQPLSNAAVMFEPENGRPSYGVTSDTGEYSLVYRGKPWGAIAGRHKVRITTEALISDSPDAAAATIRKEILPSKYHTQTTLTAEVAKGDNSIDFALQSR